MRKLGKKSVEHELMFIVFQLMIIAAIFVSLMYYVGTIKEQTLFRKLALSRDIALTMNSLYASPGNIEYNYYDSNLNLSAFDYSFDKQLVNVFEKGRATSYPCGDDTLFELFFQKISDSNNINFQNIDYTFSAKKELEAKPNLLKYPYVEIREQRGKAIVGFYNENPLANQLAAELRVEKEGIGRIASADILIIAELDNKTSKTLKIEIPSNSELVKESRKLASLIANNVLARGNIDYIYIIPTTKAELNKANSSVYVLLSNDVPIIDVSQTISRSLNQYFSS